MKLKAVLVVVAILVVVIGIGLMGPRNKQNVQMNNQTCPVSGNRVNGKDTYIHNGKEYNLCSDKCRQPLSKNPEKYLSD
jgi:YHS domain-containing protein